MDFLLFYAKSEASRLTARITRDFDHAELRRRFPKVDAGGERYNTKMTAWCSPSMGARPNLCYEFQGIHPPYPSGWRLGRDRMEEEYSKGNIVIVDGKLERRSYARDYAGVSPGNLWTDTALLLGAQSSERTGYPTQKPLALYERIIAASSNPGDLVLDPFCGCATTPVAAERLGRQWVGMDIWAGAIDVVRRRMADSRQLLADANPQVVYETAPPRRTDNIQSAPPILHTPMTTTPRHRYPAPRTHHANLLADMGAFCQGCGADYGFDSRVLEVDHINPRSQGGMDAYDNLTLLCPPCNKEKRDRYTLIGLQQANRAAGHMKNESNLRMGRAQGRSSRRRR